jgi:hypothetical protein
MLLNPFYDRKYFVSSRIVGKREFQQPCKNITLKFSNNHSIKLLELLV